jgi:hypothetical protein
MPDGAILRAAKVHPETPTVSREEWQAMNAYYGSHAPAEPPRPPKRPVARPSLEALFEIEYWHWSEAPAFVTLLYIDARRQRLLIGDGQDKSLRAVDSAGQTLWRLSVPSGPVSLTWSGPSMLVTLIGRVFPSDEPVGQLWAVTESGGEQRVDRLLRGLRRPVHASVADLDLDGREDFVVSAFGNRLGSLSLFQRLPDGAWRESLLENGPGTIRAEPVDWDEDGRLDLLVLRAQGREALEVHLNEGNGSFLKLPLVIQPPTFGFSGMELADMNGDGSDEVLLVNGDSGDYPSPPRAFHGLRIYSKTEGGGLAERMFHPLFGAYGVKARDFDGDGTRDVALISFFPDFSKRPVEAFELLRGTGPWQFEALSLPEADELRGRWLLMDAGDIDGDGDEDIVLGSFFRGPPTTPIPDALARHWETSGVSVLLLRNRQK